jgi:hypothetical protein
VTRGRASVLWWAGGFSYRLEVRRHPRTPYELDYDLEAAPSHGAVHRLRAYLHDYAPD